MGYILDVSYFNTMFCLTYIHVHSIVICNVIYTLGEIIEVTFNPSIPEIYMYGIKNIYLKYYLN